MKAQVSKLRVEATLFDDENNDLSAKPREQPLKVAPNITFLLTVVV